MSLSWFTVLLHTTRYGGGMDAVLTMLLSVMPHAARVSSENWNRLIASSELRLGWSRRWLRSARKLMRSLAVIVSALVTIGSTGTICTHAGCLVGSLDEHAPNKVKHGA